jgi:hypothetical protein
MVACDLFVALSDSKFADECFVTLGPNPATDETLHSGHLLSPEKALPIAAFV